MQASKEIPSGPAAAAVLSAGLGCFIIGLNVVLAQASPSIKKLLSWCPPAGPLSGKTGVGVITWLVLWAVLHAAWKNKELSFQRIWTATWILLTLANILVFPPVFEAFGH